MINTEFNKYINNLDLKLKSLLENSTIYEIVEFVIKNLDTEKLDYFDLTTFARDIYIGSDLTKTQKKEYYLELKKQKFFEKIESKLNSEKFNERSWTIYTIGKFSENENVSLLIKAFYKYLDEGNFILSAKCLSEIEWLEEIKSTEIIRFLKQNSNLTSKLVLLYFYEISSNDIEIKKILRKDDFYKNLSLNKVNEFESVFDTFFKIEMKVTELNYIEKKSIDKILRSHFPLI